MNVTLLLDQYVDALPFEARLQYVALKADAERYRWLRQETCWSGDEDIHRAVEWNCPNPAEADRQIDAARAVHLHVPSS